MEGVIALLAMSNVGDGIQGHGNTKARVVCGRATGASEQTKRPNQSGQPLGEKSEGAAKDTEAQ